jgi:transposase
MDKIFIHWYKDQSIDFDMYYDDVKNKKYKWEELGIIKKQKKDVIEEYNIQSSKDNYFGFWAWYYKIPFNEDINVIGNMQSIKEIINTIPDLFVDFLDKYLVPLLLEGSVGLLDNAAIHKTKESWKKMDEIFHGNWLYSSPYSPDLKPIEKCFSLVKSKLRELELEAIIRPIRTINRVIEMYSINGPEGHKCQGFWNCIKHYHQKRLLMYRM